MSRPLAAFICLAFAGATLAAFAPARGGCAATYSVARGDTLYGIARRCRSSVARIAAASRLADPNRIEVGQRLVIPGGRGERRRTVAAAGLGYRIAPSDTLYSLARWSRVSVAALLAANPGIDPRAIEIGDLVRLPAGAVEPGVARRRERRPESAQPRRAATPAPRAAAPAPEAQAEEDKDKPEEDERQPMGM